MIVRAIISKKGDEQEKFLVEATEAELEMITGIAGKPHISGRFEVDTEIAAAEVYKRLEEFTNNKEKLKEAGNSLRQTADSIKGILDLQE